MHPISCCIITDPKGNASAGLVSSKGLLTDLTTEAAKRGWGKTIGTAAVVGKYNKKAVRDQLERYLAIATDVSSDA